MDDYPAALADLNRALELDQDNARDLAQRGEIYRLMRNYPAALADFNRALELDSDDDWTLASRGDTFLLMGDYPAALVDLNHAIAMNLQNDWAFYKRGLVLLIQNRFEQAHSDFSLAIQQSSSLYENNPEDWSNTFNLALYHLAAGNVAESELLYRKALTHSIPVGDLCFASSDLNDFLHLFPNHPQAKALRDLLQQHPGKIRR